MTTITNLKRIISDVVDLCELQFQLLSIDGKVAASKAILAVVAIVLAGALAIATFTTLLLSGAWALHELFLWPLSGGLLLSAVVGALIVVGFVLIAYRAGKKASAALEETRGEIGNNLRWLKAMLKSDPESNQTPDYSPFGQRYERVISERDRAF